jgi:hypothetical protein
MDGVSVLSVTCPLSSTSIKHSTPILMEWIDQLWSWLSIQWDDLRHDSNLPTLSILQGLRLCLPDLNAGSVLTTWRSLETSHGISREDVQADLDLLAPLHESSVLTSWSRIRIGQSSMTMMLIARLKRWMFELTSLRTTTPSLVFGLYSWIDHAISHLLVLAINDWSELPSSSLCKCVILREDVPVSATAAHSVPSASSSSSSSNGHSTLSWWLNEHTLPDDAFTDTTRRTLSSAYRRVTVEEWKRELHRKNIPIVSIQDPRLSISSASQSRTLLKLLMIREVLDILPRLDISSMEATVPFQSEWVWLSSSESSASSSASIVSPRPVPTSLKPADVTLIATHSCGEQTILHSSTHLQDLNIYIWSIRARILINLLHQTVGTALITNRSRAIDYLKVSLSQQPFSGMVVPSTPSVQRIPVGSKRKREASSF